MVDMAHFAGLVAAGLHPSPVPHAHVTTTTTHKTLGGPRGGVILSNDPAIAKKINSAVFPGQQGGPLEHVIAAKAVAFKMAADPSFTERAERTIRGARLLAERLLQSDVADAGVQVLTGGTDVHLVLVDLRQSDLDGKAAEDRLHRSASPSTATPCRSTPAHRWSPPACGSAPRPWPPAASAPRLRRGRRHHRHRPHRPGRQTTHSATTPPPASAGASAPWRESSPLYPRLGRSRRRPPRLRQN